MKMSTFITHFLNFIIIFCELNNIVHAQNRTFPNGFKFGTATAAYQIEGGWNASGKGENIWDHFTHTYPEKIRNGSNGDIACDSYHKYKEDVAILKEVGVHYYRFSISWSRILPTGLINEINADGVMYYTNLIDELIQNGIEPYITLYHWDLPQPLQDIGGWANEKISDYFADYAYLVFSLFGSKVKVFITMNEPDIVCIPGYGLGTAAPGFNYSATGPYLCGKTLLLAHAKAYRIYERLFKKEQKGRVGITVNTPWCEPKSNTTADIQAAERYLLMNFGWWTYPIFSKSGDYPPIMKYRINLFSKMEGFTRSRLPPFSKEEIRIILGSADFLGFNHYTTFYCEDNDHVTLRNKLPSYSKDLGIKGSSDVSWKKATGVDWLNVVPWGFRKALNWIRETYNNPVVLITENGFSDTGGLDDIGRIHYLRDYMGAALDAIQIDGCNIQAYTVWSILDNLEWLDGFFPKFGMCAVDFNSPNRTRTPKASSRFYKNVIQTGMLQNS